jgi:TatD DNase family protein
MLIDSHCHPDGKEYDSDRAGVVLRAAAAGVGGMVAVGGGAEPGTLDCGLRVAREFGSNSPDRPQAGALAGAALPKVWTTIGIHPHEARRASAPSYEEMKSLAADPLIIAIGEIGLDFHYDHSPREAQREVFERQLALAAEVGLPISIHCRDAFDECFEVLRAAPAAKGVFHCFTGNRDQAEEALSLGFYLSFSGMLTFERAAALREVARAVPPERILIETDSPYLAPVPHRGRRNEPAWVTEVAKKLAELREWSLEETHRITSDNFFRLFARARG